MATTLPPLSVLLKDCLKDLNNAAVARPGQFTSPPISPPSLPVAPIQVSPQPEHSPELHGNFLHNDRETSPVRTPPAQNIHADEAVTLFPRRKAGQNCHEAGRGPVVLNIELLQTLYGMPLHIAAKKLVKPPASSFRCAEFRAVSIEPPVNHPILFCCLSMQGICPTAIKKVCRKLGIKKWPYKDTRTPMVKKETENSSVRVRSFPHEPCLHQNMVERPTSHLDVLSMIAAPLSPALPVKPAMPQCRDLGSMDMAVRTLLSLNAAVAIAEAPCGPRHAGPSTLPPLGGLPCLHHSLVASDNIFDVLRRSLVH